jgi:hypothetical protein
MTRFVGTPLRGIEFSSVSDEAISARVVNDSHARIRIDAGGRITWSSGSASGDVVLYRDDANHLKTDDILEATGGLITLTTNGTPTAELPNGSIAVDTTNNVFYFRSNNEWLEVSSGANVTIQATEPLDAESGDLWFDSDTLVLYILNGTSWVSVSGSLTLAELDDVDVSGVQEGDILSYDGTSWVPSLGNNSKYAIASVIGDGTTTEFSVVHNFGSRDVLVIARNNASPYENIEIGWESTDSNTVGIIFSEPPAVDGVRINVLYTGATTLSGTYSTTIGDGTSLQYLLSHNLNTRDINIVCREESSPYGVIDIAWEATTVDTATIYFSEPPALNDVRVTVYSSQVLFGGSSGGGGGASSLDELSDVAITSAANGQVLTYNGTSWVNQSAAATIDSLDDISDVNVSTAASGDFLKFDGTNWVPQDGVATETYVDTAISNLVDVAPAALDTLNELAAALGDDENFATTVTNALADKAPLASPGLTGTPTAPTAAYGTDTTQIATTEFVQDAIGGFASDLNGLSDVVITAPEEFQGLSYDGTNWVNGHIPLVSYVRNAESTTITTGTCVYLFGSTGDHATVKRADNSSDTTSSKTVGVAGANILANENGPIVTRGYVDGINLSTGYTAGDVLWLGENGAFTTTKPTAPDHLVFIGVVVRATVNGIIYVATQNGYELDELHDVAISGKISGDVLKYNGSLWVNSQLAINDLSDVDTAGIDYNSLLIHRSPGEEQPPYWQTINANDFIGSFSINSLEDVEATTFTEGSLLVYDSSEGVNAWVATLYDYALQTNQVLFWDAAESRWENRVITLGSDTVGNYVSGLNAGTGISVSHTPSEGSSPTVSLNALLDDLSNVNTSGQSFDGAGGTLLYYNGTDWVVTKNGPNGLYTSPYSLRVSESISGGSRYSSIQSSGIAVYYGDSGGTYSTNIGVSGIEVYENGNPIADFDSAKLMFISGSNYVSIKKPTTITGTNEITIPNATGTIALLGSIALGTDTTGNYVSDVTAGTNISVSHTPGEGSSPTVAVVSTPQFSSLSLDKLQLGGWAGDTTIQSLQGSVYIKPVGGYGLEVGETSSQLNGDLTVTGNLTVSGTTTTLNTENLLVEDNVVILNSGVTGSPVLEAGIEVERGTRYNAKLFWDEYGTFGRWRVLYEHVEGGSANAPIALEGMTALNNLSGVFYEVVSSGDFLKHDGSNWTTGSIELGTDTTGNYVSDITAGLGVTVTHTPGEGSSPTIAIGQDVAPQAEVNFTGVTSKKVQVGITDDREIDTVSGNLTIDSAGGTVTIDDDLVVTGNMTVSGITTTINTAELQVKDNIITLNSGAMFPTGNAGIEVNRGGGMYPTTAIRWNEMDDKWEFTNDGMTYTAIGGSVMSSSSSAALITMDIGV